MEKQNRKRDIQMLFRVTPEEKRLIQEKMWIVNMTNMREYMRKMLQKGYIVNADASEIKTLAAELQKIDVNLRQILRHVDTLGPAYAADAEELRQKQAECWDMVRQLFKEHMRLTQ
jgi:predicted DsbA family dithiol-disulfide isomerase